MNNKQKIDELKKEIAALEAEEKAVDNATLGDIMRKLKEIEKKIDNRPMVIPQIQPWNPMEHPCPKPWRSPFWYEDICSTGALSFGWQVK
jgi:hypothetical protein